MISPAPPTPSAWALAAAKLPIAFAQVREDSRLDVRLARELHPQATVVMIASGGETLVQLGRLPLGRIHAVDMNAAQLSLSRLKCFLAGQGDSDTAARLLGHEAMKPSERKKILANHLDHLGLPQDVLGPPDFTAELGPDHSGRYEICFAELRRRLGPSGISFVNETHLDTALAEVMSAANLMALFGAEATQNPRLPFAEHFALRTRAALARPDAATNPFLAQMYAGRFAPGHRYDWLMTHAPLQTEVVWHHGRMVSVLDGLPGASVDFVHLSNILDWLSPHDARTTLIAAARTLRTGGRIFIRQLNSSLEIETIGTDFIWDQRFGQDLVAEDRSFFYPQLHVGTRA